MGETPGKAVGKASGAYAHMLSRAGGGRAECWVGMSIHISLEGICENTNINPPGAINTL